MKRHIVLVLLALFTFAACATPQTGKVPQLMPDDAEGYKKNLLVNIPGVPKWVLHGQGSMSDGNFYGVGSSSAIRDRSLARETASNRAVSDLLKTLSIDSASLSKDYRSSVNGDKYDLSHEEQSIDNVVRSLTHSVVSGIQTVEFWENPNMNETFALVRLDTKKFEESLNKVKELNEKAREAIRERAEKLHKELENKISERNDKISLKVDELNKKEEELEKKQVTIDSKIKVQNAVYEVPQAEPEKVRYARTKYGTPLYDRHGSPVIEKKEWYSDIVAFFGVAAIVATAVFFH